MAQSEQVNKAVPHDDGEDKTKGADIRKGRARWLSRLAHLGKGMKMSVGSLGPL